MGKHKHKWVLKESYLDPETKNWRGKLFTCTGCPQAQLSVNIKQMMLEARRKGKPKPSILETPTEVV